MNNKVLVTAGCSFSECINWDVNHNLENRTWPIKNQHEWVKETCPIPGSNNFHPRPDQHEKFVDQVVMPWINQNNFL